MQGLPVKRACTARIGPTATLVNNGKVLIAAGEGNTTGQFGPFSSAELYDPLTGTFTATGSYQDGTSSDVTSLALWSSSNTNVVTIVASSTTFNAVTVAVWKTAVDRGGSAGGHRGRTRDCRLPRDATRGTKTVGASRSGSRRGLDGISHRRRHGHFARRYAISI